MARISIKPVKPLEMEFADGTVKKALFNNEAFIIYADEFGELNIEELQDMKYKPYDLVARFLYCGMKVIDHSVTLEETESITMGGGEALAMEVLNCVVDNFMASADENSKKKFMTEVKKMNKILME